MGFIRIVNEAFHEGGWGMWPILMLSIFAVGLIIDRSVYLFRSAIDKKKFLGIMKQLISEGNIAQAIKICSSSSKPLSRIIQSGLMRSNRPENEVKAAMDEAALRELPLIEKRTGYLASDATCKRY